MAPPPARRRLIKVQTTKRPDASEAASLNLPPTPAPPHPPPPLGARGEPSERRGAVLRITGGRHRPYREGGEGERDH